MLPSPQPLSPSHECVIPWLDALESAHRSAAISQIQVTPAAIDDVVCSLNRKPTHWIGVIEGLVKMSGDGKDGRTVTLAGFRPGGWFGEGTILKRESYRYEIRVLQPGMLAWLPVDAFETLLKESIGFSRFLMRQFNERLGHFIAYKAAWQTLNIEEQVARALVTLFDPSLYPTAGPLLQITQQELAYLVGASRQQINGALGQLRERGAAAAAYGGVRLLDFQRLRELAAQS